MVFLRSFFFNIFLYCGIASACIISIPLLFMKDKYMICAGKVLSDYVVYILKIFLNTKTEFKGLENLKKNEKYYLDSYMFGWAFCRFFWESHVLLPDIKTSELENWNNILI